MGFRLPLVFAIWGMHGRRPPLSSMHPSAEGGTLGMVFCGSCPPYSLQISVIGVCIPDVLSIVQFFQVVDICVVMETRFPVCFWVVSGMHERRPPKSSMHHSAQGGTLGMVLCGCPNSA